MKVTGHPALESVLVQDGEAVDLGPLGTLPEAARQLAARARRRVQAAPNPIRI